MPVASGAREAISAWSHHGDALPWAQWLADLRRSLDDLSGWSNEYILVASRELLASGLLTEEIEELSRESRPLLSGLLCRESWPVPAMWWREQIRYGKREGKYHVTVQMALGADNERPNGARVAASALAMLQRLHDVNTVYYADHDQPMDAAAITGTHEMRDLMQKIETLARSDGEMANDLLHSVGESVDIPESVLEENRRLRQELTEIRARLDGVQLQILEVASLAENRRRHDEA